MLEKDSKLLQELASQSKDYKERERLRALYAVSIGQPIALVCKIFCVTDDTIRNWITKWEEERSLKDNERSGRPPLLSQEDERELKQLVEENKPRKHGINASCWDCSELVKYFARKDIVVSDETIRVALTRMGARYVKAVLKYAEADESERLAFAKQFLRELHSLENSVLVLFEDEMSAEVSPRKGYGWTFEERLVVEAPQANRSRLNLFGAVSPLTGEVIQLATKESKAPAFIRFLNKVVLKHPRKRVWVYLDNYKPHFCPLVKRFLERHPNVCLKPLPRYSPELNPREYWHGFLRKKLLNNTAFNSAHELTGAIHAFTRRVPPAVVKSVCTLEPVYALAT